MDWPLTLPEAERQVGDSQRWKTRGNLCPRDGILHQTVSRLLLANHMFLGSWTIGICQEGRNLRSAPQKRHTAHPRRRPHCTPRKLSGWDRGGDKSQLSTGGNCSPSTWSPEVLRSGMATKRRPNQVCTFVEYPRTWN